MSLSRLLAALVVLAPAALAQDSIDWSGNLTKAFAEAKAKQRILMICVNARYVDGQKKEERAAKGLREVVYKDPRGVEASREFVCALLTPSSESSEFGELRLLGIEGALISPQHIFVHPDGGSILLREQYWSHGKGEPAVKALLAMMAEAQAKLAGGGAGGKAQDGDASGLVPAAPSGGDERKGWIEERLAEVVEGPDAKRRAAIDALVANDKGGDCTTPLTLLLREHEDDEELLVALIRGLGRDGLDDAALVVPDFLKHKSDKVRGNAAVTLEYIGSTDRKVVNALARAAAREKDDAIANHMYRALGRCGAGGRKARSILLKESRGAKSEFASLGPIIGLSYFEGDARAARGVEKILKRIGIPGGRRGGGRNVILRAVLCWTLASINDERSARFMREELLDRLENMKAFWVGPLKGFYEAVARRCEGNEEAMPAVEQGVRGAVAFSRGPRGGGGDDGEKRQSLMDEYRTGREFAGFVPNGDGLLGG